MSKRNEAFQSTLLKIARVFLFVPGALLLTAFLVYWFQGAGSPGFGPAKAAFSLLIFVCFLFAIVVRRCSTRAQIFIGFISMLILTTVLACETILSFYHWKFHRPENSCYLTERALTFDPVRGYRLPKTPKSYVRITKGQIEYTGAWRGNNEGYPDEGDFFPKRKAGLSQRIAVFGDSFTAASFLEPSWPSRVEELFQKSGKKTEILNFAIDGGGLGNWGSTIKHVLAGKGYEIDAIVFAVVYYDLAWRFTFSDHSAVDTHFVKRSESWDPSLNPTSVEDFRKSYSKGYGQLVSEEEVRRTTQAKKCPEELSHAFQFYLTEAAIDFALSLFRKEATFEASFLPNDPHRVELIQDIARFILERKLNAYVVWIPVPYLEPSKEDPKGKQIVLDFANQIGAKFIAGDEAFAGIPEGQRNDFRYLTDVHWNQKASDRFATFLAEKFR